VLKRPFLSLALCFAAAFGLGATGLSTDLNELVSAQKNRRNACEESIRDLARTCPPDSPKWREVSLLYRKAQERTNSFLDALVMDLRHNTLRKDYHDPIQEAEAAAAQTRTYLDTALCDGTTTQGRFIMALPLLFKLTGAISTVMDGYKAVKLVQAHQQEETRKLMRSLEDMRWRPMEEFLPAGAGGGVRLGAGKGADAGEAAIQMPPRYFRLETGFHTAPIRQAALAPGGRFLATVAEDKTVRLFEPATLAPLRVLRPPMGREEAGKLYALALSPDGNLAAVSGFTGEPGGASHRIYLLDTRDGHLVLTIPGLPQVVNALAIAPDGQTLIVHLGGRNGLRLYRLPDGTELARDPDYLAPTFAGAFAPDGRYAASSDDGYLRLYGPGLRLLAKMKASEPSPFGLAFTPDGARLAVGYADGCRVDVLNGRNLLPVVKPDLAQAVGPLSIVAWSRDGSVLFAGGGADFGPKPNPVCRWREGGRGNRTEVSVSRATLSALVPLEDGSLVAAGQDPLLVRIAPDFTVARSRSALAGELRQVRGALQVDATGDRVGLLGWRVSDPGAGAFSVSGLALGPVPAGAMAEPLLEVPGLAVAGWRDQERPTLNGKPLDGLQNHEVVRTLSVAPAGAAFALGTDWHLRLYDRTGRPGAAAQLPAACWGLNHSRDGRLIVAALADGSLRWYHPETAELLMSLYVASDGARWVLWNPEGFYAAGVGGEDLAGWQVQRAGEAGDFLPIAHFRAEAEQPKLFPLLLQTRDLSQAASRLHLTLSQAAGGGQAQAAAGGQAQAPRLPPVLTVQEPRDGATVEPGTVEFRVAVRTWKGSDALQGFRVTVDGQKLGAMKDVPPSMVARAADCFETHYTLKIPVPDRDCRIAVAAQTGEGVSEPVEVYLKVSRGLLKDHLDTAHAVALLTKAPDLNILAVGVGTYQDPALKLKFPAKDARDVTEVFRRQKNRLYADVHVTLLTDEQATRERIMAALREIRDHSDPRSVTLVFLSGHGLTNSSNNSYCFLPFDARLDPEANLVDGQQIRETLNGADGKVILFLDTCHAGNVMGAGQLRGLEDLIHLTRLINELSSAENGVTVFSSSTGRQLSLESAEWENGAFTRALKEGLAGKADPAGQGKVTVDMLDAYLRTRVRELTQGLQTPVSGKPSGGANFPLVALKAD